MSQPGVASRPGDDNLRASMLIVLAMFIFTFEDYIFKSLADRIPTGQMLAMAGLSGALGVAIWGLWRKQTLLSARLLHPSVTVRNIAEFLTSIVGMAALIANPLSLHSAIFQATPLVVTIAAVVYLREKLRFVTVAGTILGFAGVLLIIEPGHFGFRPAIILSLLCVLGVAVRDIATRTIPRDIGVIQLVFVGYLTAIPAGIILMAIQHHTPALPSLADTAILVGATLFGLLGGFALTNALRQGQASFVAPFRYSRILFAFVLGSVLLGERISPAMLWGSALLAAAGIWVFWTEARNRRQTPFLAPDRTV